MFSSLLPSVASSMKFSQNGPSKKPANRFSVRVFKNSTNVPFPYPLNGKMDVNYRGQQPPPPPPPQREQQNLNWYPASSYNTYDQRPRAAAANYAIYPSATNDNTFIYEQSTCSKSDIFSTSELDTASMTTFSPSSAFSPALSNDSMLALQSTPVESQRVVRPATPAVRSGYPHTGSQPQGAPLSRTTSTSHNAHGVASKTELSEDHRSRATNLPGRSNTPFRAPLPSIASTTAMARVPSTSGGFVEIPEYAASSMSELEVEERDRIAKINAEYNSASTGSFYASSSASSGGDGRLLSTPQGSPIFANDNLTHPGLQFPVKPLDPEFAQPSRSNIRHDSPPSVERLPSQVTLDELPIQATQSTQMPPPPIGSSRSREAGYRGDTTRRTSSQTAPEAFEGNSNFSSRSGYATYATSSQGPQDSPLERRRRPSVTGPRPDLHGQRPNSEFRDYGPYTATDYRQYDNLPTKSASEPTSSSQKDYNLRDRRDIIQSPTRENGVHPSSRTPSPRGTEDRDYRPSRRDSYAPTKDTRGGYPEPREVYTSGPLTSSPTQMRQSPVDMEDASVYPERVRTRSTSFSATNRPNLPIQSVMPDSRRGTGYERVQRDSVYATEEIEMPRGQRSDSERRSDHSPPQYFVQPSSHHSSAYDTRSSQAQASSSPLRPSSRAMERTVSTQQNPHSRSFSQDPPISRSQTPYPEPTYPSHPLDRDGSRGRLDNERQYATGNQAPRGTALAATSPSTHLNSAEAAGNARVGVPIGTPGSEPQRRYSDGDQNPPIKQQLSGRNSAPLLRSVRWNENLICPSPLFANQRRKGWFNRRGDQLWTNDGAYKAAAAGQEYPPDLEDYPEKEDGWMNEECIRIDLNHRLIPKPPLRSALKQPRA